MEATFSIIASIASIIAAFISARGAFRSLSGARDSEAHLEEARSIRDEFARRRDLSDFSKIYSELGRVLRLVAEVGPTCTPKTLRGKNHQSIAAQVEEFTRLLNEHRNKFDGPFSNIAKTFCDEVRTDIERLAAATDHASIIEHGKSIYYKLDKLNPEIKQYFDGATHTLVGT